MDLLVESFVTEKKLEERAAELEGNGRVVVFKGKNSDTEGLIRRVWNETKPVEKALHAVSGDFLLVIAPT